MTLRALYKPIFSVAKTENQYRRVLERRALDVRGYGFANKQIAYSYS
jgi:hypothetical protein